jgi:DNA-binding CsgD family transcriptional regulator
VGSRVSAPVLVGRVREQSMLRDCIDATLHGHARLVLIGGEAGIGKTALVGVVTSEAETRGARVLSGHCYDLTETPPYGPWSEIVERLAATRGQPNVLDMGAGAEVSGAANQAALFAQVKRLFAAAATDQALVLVLEDLHWADVGSLDLLRSLAHGMADLPLLIAATYRSDDVTQRHPLYALLPLLVREVDPLRLDVRRLELDAVRELVNARLKLEEADESRLVAYLEEHAEGNPLYISEVLRTLQEERFLEYDQRHDFWRLRDLALAPVPPLLRKVIERRLQRLGDAAYATLEVAAVVGPHVPLPLLGAVAGKGDDVLLDIVDAAVDARLLEAAPDGVTVRFSHALVREALYEGLAPPRRRLWHKRVAEALLAQPSPDPDRVAFHLQRSGDARAAEWLIRAGERAQQAYALLTAAERFEAALHLREAEGAAESERAGLLYRLARMRRYANPRQALAHLDDAVALAEASGDPVLGAYLASFRGGLRCTSGEIRRGVEELEQGVAAIDALSPAQRARLRRLQDRFGDPPDEYHYRGALVNWLAVAGRCAEALALGERVLARPRTAQRRGSSTYANIWRGIASAYAALGRPQDARQAYAQATAAYRAVEHHYQVGNALVLELFEVVLPYMTDDVVQRRRLAREAEEAWNRASGALDDLPPRFAQLPLLVVEGAWSEARELALAATSPTSRTSWRPLATSLLARLAYELGQPELAGRLIHEQLPAGPATAPGDAILLDTLALMRVAAALGLDDRDTATAHAWLEAHTRWLEWSGAVLGRAEGHLAWAAYYRVTGDSAAATREAELAVVSAGEPRQPLALATAYRLLGELALAARRPEQARKSLSQALRLADACAAPFERANVVLALAELRSAHGDRAEVSRLVEEARAVARQLGALPLLAHADAVTARIGAVRPAGLSEREVEVLHLVAEGLTDAQVADRLSLSPRTVSQHLRSVYNKLGVNSRAAATRFAVEHGLS